MHPAIFAPAGTFESLQAALNAGADGVYFGAGSLNMRAGGAVNFSPEELPEVIARCHDAGAGAYLALNTIICDGEKDAVRSLCTIAGEAGIDGIIAGDPAVLTILRELHIPAHITVQCNVANIDAVKFYAPYADVMVLAREVPLGTVQRITEAIRKENICGPSGNPVKIERENINSRFRDEFQGCARYVPGKEQHCGKQTEKIFSHPGTPDIIFLQRLFPAAFWAT